MARKKAGRTGFEPAEPVSRFTDLANRRFRPLSHHPFFLQDVTALLFQHHAGSEIFLAPCKRFKNCLIGKVVLQIQFESLRLKSIPRH